VGGNRLCAFDAQKLGNILHLQEDESETLQRYDLESRQWLSPISITTGQGAASYMIDGDGIFVGAGRKIFRFNPDGTGRTEIASLEHLIDGIFTDGNLILADTTTDSDGKLTIVNKTTRAITGTWNPHADPIFGADLAPGKNRVFGRSTEAGLGALSFMNYNDDGTSGNAGSISNRNVINVAPRVWVFPDESLVIDSSGTVFDVTRISYNSSLEIPITDVAFVGDDLPIFLSDGEVIAYSNILLETGRITLGNPAENIIYHDGALFAFGTTQSVEIIDPGPLNLGSRGQAKSAVSLSFTPDDVLVDNDGNLLLLSVDNLSIFRWSTSEKSYLETIPLVSPPISMTFSTELNRIYTGYGTGEIRVISLDDPTFSETDFVETPSGPRGLEAAGDILFVGHSHPRGGSLYFFATYRADGTLISKRGDKKDSNDYVWNPATRRFFHLRDSTSPNDLFWQSIEADGSLGPNKESPYHGDYVFQHPIRVNPEGSRVLTGAGNVFKAETLAFDIAIPFAISDAIWTGEDEVIAVREIAEITQLQRLSGANLTPQATAPFSGTPIRLLKTTPQPTLITLVDGIPRYFLIDPVTLEATYVSPTKPITPLAVGTTTRTVQSVTVIWRDKSDNEEGFRIQYRIRGTESWQDGLSTGSDAEDGTVAGLVAATEYEFRIIAFNPGFDSDPSETISATTLSDPNAPTGEPFNLFASRIFQDRITLEWTDNADNELEFILYRLEAPEAILSSGVRIVLPANTTSYEDTGLLSNRIHYYRIQVSNASSVGDTSAAISARTRPSAASPTPPQGSALAAVDTASATLTWSDTSTNEEGFIIRRAPATAQNSYQEIGRVGYNETTFIDPAVTPAQSYYYEILAYNQIGSRADSQKVQVEIPARGGSFTNHAIKHGDIYYLSFTRPNRVERFDLESDSWLPPLPLSEVPSALWVDDDGIYVGMGRRAVKILDDGRESQIAATSSRIHSIIATVDGFLMVSDGASNILTIRKSDASLVVTFEGDFPVGGLSRAEGSSRVFGRTIGRSPEEMLYLDFYSDGTVKDQKDSPDHGDYPPAERTFTFPDGRRVTDDSGTVYNATNLRFHGSLPASFPSMIVPRSPTFPTSTDQPTDQISLKISPPTSPTLIREIF